MRFGRRRRTAVVDPYSVDYDPTDPYCGCPTCAKALRSHTHTACESAVEAEPVAATRVLDISSAGSSTTVSNVEFWNETSEEGWVDGVSLSINVPGQEKTEIVMDRDTVDWLMVELVKRKMEWNG